MKSTTEFFSTSEYTEVIGVEYDITDKDVENVKYFRSLVERDSDIFKIRIHLSGTAIVYTESGEYTLEGYYIDVYENSQYIATYEKYTNELITIPFEI